MQNNYTTEAGYNQIEMDFIYKIFNPGQKVIEQRSQDKNSDGITEIITTKTNSTKENRQVVSVCEKAAAQLNGVKNLQGAFIDNKIISEILQHYDYQKVDQQISTMEPNIKGCQDSDQILMAIINAQTLFFALKFLEKGGKLLLKTFHGYHESDVFVNLLILKKFNLLKSKHSKS